MLNVATVRVERLKPVFKPACRLHPFQYILHLFSFIFFSFLSRKRTRKSKLQVYFMKQHFITVVISIKQKTVKPSSLESESRSVSPLVATVS